MPPSFSLPDDHDRLAELGRIAGSLVHELKNPLGVILLNAELIELQLPNLPESERSRLAKRLGRISDSGRALQAIVQSFLAFARPQRPDPDAVDLNGLLRHLLAEQEDLHRAAEIQVSFHPDALLPQVAADRVHLRSVFLNVLVNAREALAERGSERRILVVTRSHTGLARVMIANNGPALPDKVAAHLFEPFISAKESGTGLGLAIVKRLVEMHHGTIAVSSDPAQGVSFTFEFPTSLGPVPGATAELPMPDAGIAPDSILSAPAPHRPRRSAAKTRRKPSPRTT